MIPFSRQSFAGLLSSRHAAEFVMVADTMTTEDTVMVTVDMAVAAVTVVTAATAERARAREATVAKAATVEATVEATVATVATADMVAMTLDMAATVARAKARAATVATVASAASTDMAEATEAAGATAAKYGYSKSRDMESVWQGQGQGVLVRKDRPLAEIVNINCLRCVLVCFVWLTDLFSN